MKINRFIALFAGVSIPYSFLNIGTFIRLWTLGTFGMLLFVLYNFWGLIHFNKLTNSYGKFIRYPLFYTSILIVMNIYNYSFVNNTPIINFTFILNLLFLYCLLLQNIRDKICIDYCTFGCILGILSQPICFMLGIGVGFDGAEGRLTVFEQNTNMVGIEVCLATAVLVNGYVFSNQLNLGKVRFILLLLLVPIVAFITAAASRTAFLCLVVVFVFSVLLSQEQNRFFKVIVVIVGTLSLMWFLDNLINSDSLLLDRLLRTKNEGDVSERADLFNALYPCVWEHPVFGVGETGYVDVARRTVGLITQDSGAVIPRSPHNVILEIALYTGFIGLLMWVLFWLTLFHRSYRVYKNCSNSTLLIMLIPLIFALLSQQVLLTTWPYFIYAFVLCKTYNIDLLDHEYSNN